jgi:uncharacterized protein
MTATITALYRYPVKGLSPEPLVRVAVPAGGTIPFDRAYAIENGPGRFDPEAPRHLPKITYLCLMRDERLATLITQFDAASETLSVLRGGRQVARGDLRTKIGRQMIEQFFAAYMKAELRGAPRVLAAPGHSFSDVAEKCLHIVNLASLRDVERVMGRRVDPLRFRPNVVIDGLPPWAEFDLVGRDLTLGGLTLRAFKRTQRCAATDVDPATGVRDLAVPESLERMWQHRDFGIYATVAGGGGLAVGDALTIGG